MIGEAFTKHGSDKDTHHSYGHIYDKLLEPMRGSLSSILEIGVASGASLKAWREHFPGVQVVGFDIVPKSDPLVIQGDQGNPADLAKLAPYAPFDLIVDDGSHVWSDQFWSLLYLWQYLKEGGWYVIEDIQNPDALEYIFGKLLVDLRHERSVSDNALVVLSKYSPYI